MPAGRKEKFLPITGIGTKDKFLIRKNTKESAQFDKDKADTYKMLSKTPKLNGTKNVDKTKIDKRVSDTVAAVQAYSRKRVKSGK